MQPGFCSATRRRTRVPLLCAGRRRNLNLVRRIWNGSTEPYCPNPPSKLSVPACGGMFDDEEPKPGTFGESCSRTAAIRQLMSRKAHSTSRGSMLSRQPAVTIGTSPCAEGRAARPGHFPIHVLGGGPEQCRLLEVEENFCSFTDFGFLPNAEFPQGEDKRVTTCTEHTGPTTPAHTLGSIRSKPVAHLAANLLTYRCQHSMACLG